MDNRNDIIKAMILLPDGKENKVMTDPSYDEILAAQGLLELSRVIRTFCDNIKPTNTVDVVNPLLPIPVNQNKFSNYQRFPTYIPMANLQADKVNPIDEETGPILSPTYPTYSPYAVPTHQMTSMNVTTKCKRPQTRPSLIPYISSRLTLSSKGEEEDAKFAVVKNEERVGVKDENEDEKLRVTKKRKFYINQVSKQREADISYHRKKLDVHMKMEQYRYD